MCWHVLSQHNLIQEFDLDHIKLLNFLRATCLDPLLQESWVSRETVLTTATADRRQRAVTLKDEYVEPVRSSTESPGMHLRLRGSVQQEQQQQEQQQQQQQVVLRGGGGYPLGGKEGEENCKWLKKAKRGEERKRRRKEGREGRKGEHVP